MAGTPPKWITGIKNDAVRKRWVGWWKKPWTCPTASSKAKGFKAALWKHGLVTPNFTKAEAKSKDGRAVPDNLRAGCQKQGFLLERYRHKIGDRAVRILSWYRSPQHNAAVGGATSSKHMQATAIDPVTPLNTRIAQDVWRYGGIGYQGYVGGPVRHVDTGPKRAWVY